MSKNKAIGTFIVIALIMIVGFIEGETHEPKIEWINTSLGLFGGLLSLGGVVMALVQIRQADIQIRKTAENVETVAQITEKIQQAVNENREEIRDFLSISEVVHLAESILNAQVHIRQKSYTSAVLLLQMIKDDLIRANAQFGDILGERSENLPDIISKLNLDIESLAKYGLYRKEETDSYTLLKPEVIHENLEKARELVIKIESSLKKKKI